MSKTKLVMPNKPMGRPRMRPDAETLCKLYGEKSVKEIAEMYGVKDATVRCWASRIRKGDITE